MHNELWDVYDRIHQKGISSFLMDAVFIDPYLCQKDERLGLTLRYRLNPEKADILSPIIDDLYKIEPQLYLYSPKEIHLTFCTIITCKLEFSYSTSELKELIHMVNENLQNILNHSLIIQGLCLSNNAILLQCFCNAQLQDIRLDLIKTLEQKFKFISYRFIPDSFHMTLARFKHPITNPERLIDYCDNNRKTYYSETKIKHMELVVNDWFHKSDKTKIIHQFNFSK